MMSPVTATTRNIRIAESVKVAATAESGREPAEETSAWARSLVMMTTVPSAAVLMSALTASQRPWVPNMRFMPGNGLIFFRVGFIDFVAKVTPPWEAEATVPTTIIPTAVGRIVVMKAVSAAPSSSWTASTSGFAATTPTCTNSCCTDSKALLTSIGSSALAAATPSQVPSSWVLGICPSLRAFFRRCGVGFSVFSPPGPSLAMSAALQRHHGAGTVLEQGVERGRQQREGESQHRQGEHDLHREADGEDVQRRGRAAEQRECDVGEQQHRHHRPGDLQRRQEHHREGGQDDGRELVGGDVGADGEPLVRRGEPLD